MARTGIRIGGEVLAAMNKMTDSDVGLLVKAMAAYSLGGEEKALPERLALLFEVVKALMDRDAASAACGKQGGRPRKRSGEIVQSVAEGTAAQEAKTAPAADAIPEGADRAAQGRENPPQGNTAPETTGKAPEKAPEKAAEEAAKEAAKEAVTAVPEKGMPAAGILSGGHSLPKGCAFVEDDGIPLPWDDWTPSAAYASVPEKSGGIGTETDAQIGLPAPSPSAPAAANAPVPSALAAASIAAPSAPAAANAPDLSDVEEAYRAQGIPLGPWAMNDIAEYMKMGVEKELLFYALEQAVASNCLKWVYCRGVLNNLWRDGIHTVSSAGKRGKPESLKMETTRNGGRLENWDTW